MSAAKIINWVENSNLEDVPHDGIVVCDNINGARVVNLALEHGARHIVQKQGLEYDQEIRVAHLIQQDPSRFLNEPIETIFGQPLIDKFPHFLLHCNATARKHLVLESLKEYMAALSKTRKIRHEASLVADELFTNGAKNMLRVSDPKNVAAGKIEFFAAADGHRMLLGCIDSFGALDYRHLLRAIESCFSKGVAQAIRADGNGAGIGSFLVFESCVSIYIGVQRGQRTLVCCALPLGMTSKIPVEIPKNLHVVEIG